MARFKELFPDMKSPDSLYDKSPVGLNLTVEQWNNLMWTKNETENVVPSTSF